MIRSSSNGGMIDSAAFGGKCLGASLALVAGGADDDDLRPVGLDALRA
jgi:hypothetical protein